jgi:sugar lactone lactonase YvrE
MRQLQGEHRLVRRTTSTVRGLALPVLACLLSLTIPAAASAAGTRSIWTIAGNGTSCSTSPACGDGGSAASAQIAFPQGLAVDSSGNVYVADYGDNEIRKISPTGAISVVAGDGTMCTSAPDCGDGGPATSAQLSSPTAVAVDRHGNLFIADSGDDEIRMVSSKGTISRLAGIGVDCSGSGNCGDGGPAVMADLTAPDGVAVDSSGTIYIADTGNNEVRKVARDGTITTIAGNGALCTTAPTCGDGGSATAAELNFPEAVAVDSHGHVFIADNGDNEIREISHGNISRVAGDGSACSAAPSCGDGGPAINAQLNLPEGVAVDGRGNLYIADWGGNEIRVVSGRGTISRLAGTGSACGAPPACGDTGAASRATLNSPQGLAVDGPGNLYIGDTFDNEVRFVPATTAAPLRLRTASGNVFAQLFQTSVRRSSVTVRYLLSGSASVSLRVAPAHGRSVLVARGHGVSGWQQIAWNRRFGRRGASRGRYTLTLTISGGGQSVSTSVNIFI